MNYVAVCTFQHIQRRRNLFQYFTQPHSHFFPHYSLNYRNHIITYTFDNLNITNTKILIAEKSLHKAQFGYSGLLSILCLIWQNCQSKCDKLFSKCLEFYQLLLFRLNLQRNMLDYHFECVFCLMRFINFYVLVGLGIRKLSSEVG